MKLVEIKDIREGQIYERSRCIFVVMRRSGIDSVVLRLYCHNHKPEPNNAYEAQAMHEVRIDALNDCQLIGKIGITHSIEGKKLVEITRTSGFQTDDVVKFNWSDPRLYVINREIDFGIKETHPDNACFEATNGLYGSRQLVDFELKRVGILGVTHEFINDREAK